MKKSMRIVGPRDRIVIPEEIRNETGLVEGSEVSVEAKDGEIFIRRIGPPLGSFVDYFIATNGQKVGKRVDIKSTSQSRAPE
jgi:AbrB family looped-hinge helix DNA binding protein